MKQTLALTLAALTATAVLAGCGGDDGEAAPVTEATTSAAVEEVEVKVTMNDTGSLDALFNGEGGQCTSYNFAEALDVTMDNPDLSPEAVQQLLPKTTLTLKNADGSTIGVEELPQYGGLFDKATGCIWPITFSGVEPSEFYEVTVEHGDFTKTETQEGSPDSDASIDLAF